MVCRAIHRPSSEHVAGVSRSHLNPEYGALGDLVVHLDDLGPRMLWMGYQLQLDDSTPLHVKLSRLFTLHGAVFKNYGLIHASEDEVSELLVSPVKGANVPANADVYKR